jgi:hypothetical protein
LLRCLGPSLWKASTATSAMAIHGLWSGRTSNSSSVTFACDSAVFTKSFSLASLCVQCLMSF